MEEIIYLKITNKDENHHGFQYQDGLNILKEKFNDDPDLSCVSGGFYFTTREFIHEFYDFGINLRIVKLPINDPDFKMVKDPDNNKWRANKIILVEKYSLDDITIYTKLNIIAPTFEQCIKSGLLEIIKYLVECGNDIHANNDNALQLSAELGRFEIVKYFVEKGADIHVCHDWSLRWSSYNGYLEIVKYLIEKGADIHAYNEDALTTSIKRGHFEIVKYLIEKGADIHVDNGLPLALAIINNNCALIKYLMGKGASFNKNIDHNVSCENYEKNLDKEVISLLLENGATIYDINYYTKLLNDDMESSKMEEVD